MNLDNVNLKELADFIARREVSSEQAVRFCLDRIAQWQPSRNAFIEVNADQALAKARELDKHLANGGSPKGPLHGVPLAHKDMFYRPGEVSTGGTEIRRGWTPTTKATVLDRLDAAGAIDIGRLGMAEFAAGPTGHNIHYGHCRNAHNPDYVSGGSSSGSGVAVAARLAFGALGSDTGGSVRLPAAANGVVGLKPTYGRISRYGAMPRSWSLDHVGVLARTAADCALLLQVVAGSDVMDSTSSHHSVPDYMAGLNSPVKGLRVGVIDPESVDIEIDPVVVQGLADALKHLESIGAIPVKIKLPDLRTVFYVAETIVKCEAATMHREWIKSRPQDYSPQVRSRIEAGLVIPATYYLDALRLRKHLTAEFLNEVMSGIDVLQLPVMCGPVPTVADTETGGDGVRVKALVNMMTVLTRPINLYGLPSISLPCGFDGNGLPLSFQLVGRPFQEARLLNIAYAYEQVAQYHRNDPSL